MSSDRSSESLAGNYFVSTYPPFFFWSESELDRYRTRLGRPAPGGVEQPRPDRDPFGLYLHLPFCVERCRFCYYLSHAGRQDEIDRYINGLLRELDLYLAQPAFGGRPLSFVYFGGGTPSLLSGPQIDRLFNGLQDLLPWDDVREVTFECAPQSVTQDKMRILREAGVTRVSMGVQQLDDEILKLNGRVHQVRDVEEAWTGIRASAFDVVNIDLIVGLVGETDTTFFSGLEKVVEMAPDSVTIYQLEIPHNTPLYRSLRDAMVDPPASWDVKRRRLGAAFDRLEAAGYELRSAYMAVRDPDRHSFIYQDEQYRGADLLGLGASAFSYLDGFGQQNVTRLDAYLDTLQDGGLPLGRAYSMNARERLIREVVLQMKLGGLDRSYFEAKFGSSALEPIASTLNRFVTAGWMVRRPDGMWLTRDGLLRADRLLPELYLPEHRGSRYS